MSYKYRIDHISKDTPCDRRPSHPLNATTITIHNTGNSSSIAQNERDWLTNPKNQQTASYHIVIDEREAIECIPLHENAWHAGDGNGDGNRKSIGIEICESGDYAKTLENTAHLVAKMLQERGWGVDKLRRHFDWTGKLCPRLMYNSGKWTRWQEFKAEVEKRMKAEDKPELKVAKLYVDGKRIKDGVIIDGKTYFPGSAIAAAMGANIAWDNENKVTKITTKKNGVK